MYRPGVMSLEPVAASRLTACARIAVVCVVALINCGSARTAEAQDSGPEFERQNRVADLIRLLAVAPGSTVADVGAGEGAFTIPMARAVAPGGRVAAVDIRESALTKLRERAARESTANVDIVLGAVDDPHLGVAQFDAALIHNAYHEMTAHEAILGHIRAALKPGGHLLIVEPLHDTSRGLPRERQVENHDIEPGIVDGELKAAGFEVVERDDNFIKFTDVPGGFWLILARRP